MKPELKYLAEYRSAFVATHSGTKYSLYLSRRYLILLAALDVAPKFHSKIIFIIIIRYIDPIYWVIPIDPRCIVDNNNFFY